MTDKALSGQPTPSTSTAKRFWQEVRGYLEALVIAFVIVTFGFNTVGVVGSSMRPNLNGGPEGASMVQSMLSGDRVFIPKYETWLRRAGLMAGYQRGDIVVVREPTNSPNSLGKRYRSFFIKRVIGMPGDRIKIQAGQVFINGYALDQGFIDGTGEIEIEPQDFPIITQENGTVTGISLIFQEYQGFNIPSLPLDTFRPTIFPTDSKDVQFYYGKVLAGISDLPATAPENKPFLAEFVVADGHYFIMGDNRSPSGSEDSRYFGPIPMLSIAGRASAVIWPPRREGDWNWRLLTPPNTFENNCTVVPHFLLSTLLLWLISS
jgi:signal peptidase I